MSDYIQDQVITNQEVIDFNNYGYQTIRCLKTPKRNHTLNFDPQAVDKIQGLKTYKMIILFLRRFLKFLINFHL